jgi:hypothetical protein
MESVSSSPSDAAVAGGFNPSIAAQHGVVVGQLEEMIPVRVIPIGGDFRELVGVGPQGVGVEIALPPIGSVAGGQRRGVAAKVILGGTLRESGACEEREAEGDGSEGAVLHGATLLGGIVFLACEVSLSKVCEGGKPTCPEILARPADEGCGEKVPDTSPPRLAPLECPTRPTSFA